ncbi:MAG: glucose 1-dehydrogenase, partial [Longimicrobiales bacterium]
TMKLAGGTAIVTGSDSGIGQAIAAELAAAGADVCVTFHTDEHGANDTGRMVEAVGRRAIVMQVDVRDEKSVERMFDRTVKQLGSPDILVNNAAVNADGTHVVDMATDAWDTVLRTNLYGPFFACRRFIRERRTAGGGGRIINVTSVHEEIPMKGGGAYDATKGGLRLLTRTLALEAAEDRITVNNIAPGMILTPMNPEALTDPAEREKQTRHIPWKRAGRPEEVAKLAVYLASTDADYVTGASFFIDGGLRMMMGQGA